MFSKKENETSIEAVANTLKQGAEFHKIFADGHKIAEAVMGLEQSVTKLKGTIASLEADKERAIKDTNAAEDKLAETRDAVKKTINDATVEAATIKRTANAEAAKVAAESQAKLDEVNDAIEVAQAQLNDINTVKSLAQSEVDGLQAEIKTIREKVKGL